jgi:hypothetical protein
MGKSRVLWDNAVTRSVINASAEDAGYPDDNVATWRETSIWKASGDNDYTFVFEFTESAGETIKAFALMAHNLHTCGARYKVEGLVSPDSSELQATPLVPYEYPADDFCLVKFFTGGVFSEVHLHIDNNRGGNFSPQIGIVFLGDYLEIPRNPDPNGLDPDKHEEVSESQTSETGVLMGTGISFVKRTPSFSYPYLDPSFITGTWLPFRAAHRGKPFFFGWDSAKPAETYLVQFASQQITTPYNAVLYRSLQFDLVGRKEE